MLIIGRNICKRRSDNAIEIVNIKRNAIEKMDSFVMMKLYAFAVTLSTSHFITWWNLFFYPYIERYNGNKVAEVTRRLSNE